MSQYEDVLGAPWSHGCEERCVRQEEARKVDVFACGVREAEVGVAFPDGATQRGGAGDDTFPGVACTGPSHRQFLTPVA